jgi:hypothetical protein
VISTFAFATLLLTRIKLPEKAPKWMDNELAGYAFASDIKHHDVAVIDPVSRYMLIRVIECDGADITLLLTKDRYEVDNMGIGIPGFSKDLTNKDIQAVEKPLPNLRTGKGVMIDMAMQSVIFKIGLPTKRYKTGKRNQYLNLEYSWTEGKGITAGLYEQTYVFKSGKLIEILFTKGPDNGYSDMAIIAPKAKDAVARRKGD